MNHQTISCFDQHVDYDSGYDADVEDNGNDDFDNNQNTANLFSQKKATPTIPVLLCFDNHFKYDYNHDEDVDDNNNKEDHTTSRKYPTVKIKEEPQDDNMMLSNDTSAFDYLSVPIKQEPDDDMLVPRLCTATTNDYSNDWYHDLMGSDNYKWMRTDNNNYDEWLDNCADYGLEKVLWATI